MANRRHDGAPEPVRIDALSPELASEAGDLLAASHADYPPLQAPLPRPAPTTPGAAPLHERHSARCRSARTGHGGLRRRRWRDSRRRPVDAARYLSSLLLAQGAYDTCAPASSPFSQRCLPGIRARGRHPGEGSPSRLLVVPAGHGRPSARPTPWRRQAAAQPHARSCRRVWLVLQPAHLGPSKHCILWALRVRGQPACHRGVRARTSPHRHDPATTRRQHSGYLTQFLAPSLGPAL
jgi:hypothetical protein